MLLQVKRRLTGGVAILDLIGQATAGAAADSLRAHILEAFQKGSHYILLNCEELDYADSSAVGEMVSAYSSILRGGGMLKLLRPPKRVRHVLEVTHLDQVFEVLDNEQVAIASFSAASAARGQQSMDAFLRDD